MREKTAAEKLGNLFGIEKSIGCRYSRFAEFKRLEIGTYKTRKRKFTYITMIEIVVLVRNILVGTVFVHAGFLGRFPLEMLIRMH